MSDDEILEKMHILHLILADEVKRICEKFHLRFFMIAGTMLGAVRHKGFIPWDDDMDFGMPRDDYDRFISLCETELDKEKFYLQTDEKEKFYPFNFAKLRPNNTKVEEEFSHNAQVHQGIYIDIFPVDVVPDNKIRKAIQYGQFWIVRNLLWVKCNYGSSARRKNISYKAAFAISHLFSVYMLKMVKRKCITRYRGCKSQYVVVSDGNYGLKKETLLSEWVQDTDNYVFEDRVFPGIKAYKEYLTYFYGDYMQIPPVEQRNHHLRYKVDFGIYDEKSKGKNV